MPSSPLRILVFAEGATLAHVGRPYLLAESLAEKRCEIIFARPSDYAWLTRQAPFEVTNLQCQHASIFSQRLEKGSPLYDLPTLESYVEQDRLLIKKYCPDVILGDFRLSLSVSARLENIPYATICDAYWSPEAGTLNPPLPSLNFARHLPLAVAESVFRLIAPIAFGIHANPMNQLRRKHNLKTFGNDIRLAYTDSDLRLFANIPQLFPQIRTHDGACFIGPICWSPRMPLPTSFPADQTLVYVSMGSSGNTDILSTVFAALQNLSLPAVVSTAGRPIPAVNELNNVWVYDYLPGDTAAAMATLTICNGGSPTTNQAIIAGCPVLGITTNMDQMLNMRAISQAGCGVSLRSDRITITTVENAIQTLLDTKTANSRACSQDIAAGVASSAMKDPGIGALANLLRLKNRAS